MEEEPAVPFLREASCYRHNRVLWSLTGKSQTLKVFRCLETGPEQAIAGLGMPSWVSEKCRTSAATWFSASSSPSPQKKTSHG